ncbi:Alkaline_phosphatase [Hexamita inflata]|uniref:Alkaline phosphatase n=1 Tax=Hexamita inflata TaxID=28002 RepID=A0AA86QWE5_9EUKA|nr:Alkaline phosphatase [Hexamita inflata]
MKVSTQSQVQKTVQLQQTLKILKFIRIVQYFAILYFAIVHAVITGTYLVSKVIFYGSLQRAYLNSIKIAVCISVILIQMLVVRRYKTVKIIQAQIIFNLLFIILLTLDLVYFLQQFRDIDYGPLTIINGNQTQIHWYTKKRSSSMVTVDDTIINDDSKSNFHNVLINQTNFSFKVSNISALTYNYSLPSSISKFVVMTDIHSNGHYIEQMSSDYDFALLCGDYSYGGLPHEFSKTFRKSHNKPLILAAGNHDSLGQIDRLITRPTNFYQKIGDNGFYFIYVLNTDLVYHSHLNHSRTDAAFTFLNENLYLSNNDKNVFIVSHQAVYSTGDFGSIKYFTEKMEEFMNINTNKRIRAVFSGHDHVFNAFRRLDTLYFVNGAGGGPLDNVKSQGARSWSGEELKGPMPENGDREMGYQYHLNSYRKYTRTEVGIMAGKIEYTVRDLDSGKVLNVYEQITE